jgi:hypothetical protein
LSASKSVLLASTLLLHRKQAVIPESGQEGSYSTPHVFGSKQGSSPFGPFSCRVPYRCYYDSAMPPVACLEIDQSSTTRQHKRAPCDRTLSCVVGWFLSGILGIAVRVRAPGRPWHVRDNVLSGGEGSVRRHGIIGREDQELLPVMCCRGAFVPCAIPDGPAIPLQKASGLLG